jgi:replication factor C large subunit
MMLSEKLRPRNIAAMVGNEQPRLEIVRWLKYWKIGAKPLLLTGPPGIGKSSSIYAVASEFHYTVLEYNASDVRTREHLREEIGPLLSNSTLFAGEEKILIFLDEVDGLSGRSDYAGMDYVLEFIEDSTLPVAMAANVEDDQKIKKLVQKSHHIRFRPVAPDLLFIYLKSVAKREGFRGILDDTLWQISRSSRGDVRFALNSLQTLSGRRGEFKDHTDIQFPSDAEAISSVFEARNLEKTIERMRDLDIQPRDKIRYFFDSVVSAKNLDAESRSEALDLISRADALIGRIGQTQSWRLLRYLDRYLAMAVSGRGLSFADSSIPWNLRLSIWNDGRVTREMNPILSSRYHVGKSDFSSFYLPYFSLYLRKNQIVLQDFLTRNDLSESARRVILKLGARK